MSKFWEDHKTGSKYRVESFLGVTPRKYKEVETNTPGKIDLFVSSFICLDESEVPRQNYRTEDTSEGTRRWQWTRRFCLNPDEKTHTGVWCHE